MLESGMESSRVNKIRQAKLFDVTKPLKVRMRDDIVEQIARYGDKSIYRIVDGLFLVQLQEFICSHTRLKR